MSFPLFKYIRFECDYWHQPLVEGKLYFSSKADLHGVNDLEEFHHDWSSPFWIFRKMELEFKARYERLFSSSRILCLSKHLNRRCWQEFCPDDSGLCYEFQFDPQRADQDISRRDVWYSNSKQHNVPLNMLTKVRSKEIKRIMMSVEKPVESDIRAIMRWMDTLEPRNILNSHIADELTFKKRKKFTYEKEYRFIHLERTIREVPLAVHFDDRGKLKFEELGLTLKRIYTSDIRKVQSIGENAGVEIVQYPI